MSRIIRKGSVDQSIYLEVLDSASTTGGRKTGLVYNTSGLTAYYARNGGSATAITLATLAAANSAHSDGGFKEVDGTNMPGLYRLDLPDAAVASGADSVVVTLFGAAGMAQVSSEIQLVAHDPQDSVRAGLTALPNAAAEAAGGLYTRGAGAGQINQNANGQIDARAVAMAAAAVQAIWDALTSALTTASSIGKLLVDNVNATISSRSTYAGGDTSGTTTLLSRIGGAITITSGKVDVNDKTGFALTSGERDSVADALLDRNMGTGTDSGSPSVRTVRQALRFLRNKWAISAGALTVYKEDDSTSSWTATVGTDAAAVPIVSNDPA